MLLLYYITSFVLEPFTSFSMSCDHVEVVTVTCDIILTLTLSPKVRNKWKEKEKLRIKNFKKLKKTKSNIDNK